MSYRPPIVSRTWGTRFDNLLASPSITPPTQDTAFGPTSTDPDITSSKEEKTPHDASIFVGSLPCNIDQEELGRLLSDHLAEHLEIKSVKVVRDSKGGVCAFLQCEDSLSAASLIRTLRSGPLRPFMGRILRYEPARAFRTLLVSYRAPVQVLGAAGTGGRRQTVMLDLPYAMRLCKPDVGKYFNVVYNAEAVDVENRCNAASVENAGGHFFMHPMVYDAEAIRSLASFFGLLESFERVKIDEVDDDNSYDATRQLYPYPHNGPRSACMDTGCWEVKWRHRDDCVNALMTLRRIPHLTASWAHQPPQCISDQSAAHRHLKDSKAKAPPPTLSSCSRDLSRSPLACVLTSTCTNASPAKTEDIEFGYSSSIRQKNSFDYNLDPEIERVQQGERLKLNWSDEDFQPITDSQTVGKPEWGAWEGVEIDQPITQVDSATYVEEQSDTLSTPGLGMSPITPRSFGSTFPGTPTDLSGELSGLTVDPKMDRDDSYNTGTLKGRSVDPSTLFVGGLEMFGPSAWDETKVRKCFERYGILESVKFFRPYNSCSAFAFVKFKTTDGPARAIKEEHNRVYEGKAIRVQLRECNASRSTWKPLRSRGRYCGSQQMGLNRRASTTNRKDDTQSEYQRNNFVGSEDSAPTQREDSEVHKSSFDPGHNPLSSTEGANLGALDLPTNVASSCSVESNTGGKEESYPRSQGVGSVPTSSPVAMPHPLTYPSFGYCPAPWFYPYLQQMQYQFPYYPGYPGYMIPPATTRTPASVGINTSASVQPPWHAPSNPYAPYVPYAMPRIPQTQATDASAPTASITQPLPSFCQSDQVAVQSDSSEQGISGVQGVTTSVVQAQLNPSAWPHYPFQPYQYPAPGSFNAPLSASAKAFVPPVPSWDAQHSISSFESQTNLGSSHSVSYPQLARRDQQAHTTHGRLAPNGVPFGRNFRATTNSNLSRDNDQFGQPKSTLNSNSASWI